jgi:hypothetical protein
VEERNGTPGTWTTRSFKNAMPGAKRDLERGESETWHVKVAWQGVTVTVTVSQSIKIVNGPLVTLSVPFSSFIVAWPLR